MLRPLRSSYRLVFHNVSHILTLVIFTVYLAPQGWYTETLSLGYRTVTSHTLTHPHTHTHPPTHTHTHTHTSLCKGLCGSQRQKAQQVKSTIKKNTLLLECLQQTISIGHLKLEFVMTTTDLAGTTLSDMSRWGPMQRRKWAKPTGRSLSQVQTSWSTQFYSSPMKRNGGFLPVIKEHAHKLVQSILW